MKIANRYRVGTLPLPTTTRSHAAATRLAGFTRALIVAALA